MIRAVLFDFDGVIAATIEDNARAWGSAVETLGGSFRPVDFFLSEGSGLRRTAELLAEKGGLSTATVPAMIEAKEAHYRQHHQFRLYPGVSELIRELSRRGVRMAVVTGAAKSRFLATFPGELMELLATVVTGDDVQNTKPHPEPYETAMRKLGVEPNECVVVENAPLGVRAAKASGAICLAVTTTLSADHLAEADEIFKSHSALISRLLQLTTGDELAIA